MDTCVLSVVADDEIRDSLVDWLLSYHDDLVFSADPVSCYGVDHASMQLAEQVTGRRRKLMFQLQVPLATARALRDGLSEAFPQAELRYWIVPVLEAGDLGRAAGPRGGA